MGERGDEEGGDGEEIVKKEWKGERVERGRELKRQLNFNKLMTVDFGALF